MSTSFLNRCFTGRRLIPALGLLLTLTLVTHISSPVAAQTAAAAPAYELNDSHLHLWNYIQQGPTIQEFLKVMGTRVGRVAIFGLPLQQMWAYGNTGDFAPWYYTQTDAPLYYYSFIDAMMAMAYRSLTPEQQARFDPMIIGFNPADMYAVGPHPARPARRSRGCSRGSASSRSTRSSCPRRPPAGLRA